MCQEIIRLEADVKAGKLDQLARQAKEDSPPGSARPFEALRFPAILVSLLAAPSGGP